MHNFDMEEIDDSKKLKLASYYLNNMALCWQQKYIRSFEGHEVTCGEYMEAYVLGLWIKMMDQNDLLEELINLR